MSTTYRVMVTGGTESATWEMLDGVESVAWESDAAVVVTTAPADLEEALEEDDSVTLYEITSRTWELREDGNHYTTIEAATAEEALDEARSNVDRSNYHECEGTLYIDVRVDAEDDDTVSASDTVTLEPEEPECSHEDGHDWQSPHEIVGGLRENPGVQGHGGGVIIQEVCMHCGCGRTTDTWAQRPDTGRQGLREVSYEPGQYADEIAELEEVAS